VVPISDWARSLAVVESLCGTIYMAILVVRLIRLHLTHAGCRVDRGTVRRRPVSVAALAWLVASALGFCVVAAVPAVAYGQSLEPRAYSNVPVGLNFALAGYLYTQGSVGTDATLPIKDFTVRTNGPSSPTCAPSTSGANPASST
jgi:hypothetical protein